MACIKKTSKMEEREEGEIVDELDDLSDISSEEEYLLRQRLQVLESYNYVLERKEAKRTLEIDPRKKDGGGDTLWYDLSEISATDLEENLLNKSPVKIKNKDNVKPYHHKTKKKKIKQPHKPQTTHKTKESTKRKLHKLKVKKKMATTIISESSDDEDFEFLNKRKKLADAVTIKKEKLDKTSLKARLMNMFASTNDIHHIKSAVNVSQEDKTDHLPKNSEIESNTNQLPTNNNNFQDHTMANDDCVELIDLCVDDEEQNEKTSQEEAIVNEVAVGCDNEKLEESKLLTSDSDDDLEMLRQHALKSKTAKIVTDPAHTIVNNQSEDEDKELRLICLKSAFLKKAIEMKRKQKLQKRISQSSNLGEDLLTSTEFSIDNNTDIESVDMDTAVSDGPEERENENEFCDSYKTNERQTENENNQSIKTRRSSKEDEIEEDEDLLRAKLLSSLSSNLPKLVTTQDNNNHLDPVPTEKNNEKVTSQVSTIPEIKRFIINTKDSDSGSDTEATKNLTKMHNKLAPLDFQQRLDLFLKSTRMEVENKTLPDVIQQPNDAATPKPQEKFVPKVVNHLPKSEQLEYKNLVKRMAELEKMKRARQQSMLNMKRTVEINVKDTLKPINVAVDTNNVVHTVNLEEQISLSRKKIAEESAKVMKLKEERKNLTQKYKIINTELRNLSTALTFNKRQVRIAQTKLSKISAQHQLLLRRSSIYVNKEPAPPIATKQIPKIIPISKTQKENAPFKPNNILNGDILKAVRVSIVNDIKEKKTMSDPHVQVDKKVVKISKELSPKKDIYLVESMNPASTISLGSKEHNLQAHKSCKIDNSSIRNMEGDKIHLEEHKSMNPESYSRRKSTDDYQSPLQAMLSATWHEDPHGVLCPFEVAGVCKDTSCQYLHPKSNTVPHS